MSLCKDTHLFDMMCHCYFLTDPRYKYFLMLDFKFACNNNCIN